MTPSHRFFLHRVIWRQQLRDAFFYWLFLPGAVIGPGLAADRLLALPMLPAPRLRLAAGMAAAVIGGLLIGRAMRDLDRLGGGTPNPLRPPRILVTKRSYQLCRHPMWLGYDLAALGVTLVLGSPATLFASLPLFFVWQIRFLRREEHVLARKFKTSYPAYQRETPFLLPWPRRRAAAAGSSAPQGTGAQAADHRQPPASATPSANKDD